MNWKSFLKRVLIIGFMLIPLNLFLVFVSISPVSYDVTFLKGLILLVGIFLLAAISIFRFVYRRAERFKTIQALATIFLSEIVGYVLAFAGVLIVLLIIS